MIQPICRDTFFLSQKSRDYTPADAPIAQDLQDTLLANKAVCVGMAANMIGKAVRIVAFFDGDRLLCLCNPQILRGKDLYRTEEGCLSLSGVRETNRYDSVKVSYDTLQGQHRIRSFHGYSAQILQHEIDHTQGILI